MELEFQDLPGGQRASSLANVTHAEHSEHVWEGLTALAISGFQLRVDVVAISDSDASL